MNSIPDSVKNFINQYFELRIKDQKVRCPYFINLNGMLKSPVMSGKGTPEEIENQANSIIKTESNNAKEIRKQMQELGLGVDCSGLVYNIYDFWIGEKFQGKKSLCDFLPTVSIFNLRKYLSRLKKPQNSVSADEFTSSPLANKIEIKKARPGDLIRTRGGKHVLFITEVETQNDLIQKICFVNSAREYKLNGVRYGEIIFDENQSLNTAKWIDIPEEEVNFTSKGYRESINSNGIFRPNLPLFED